MKHIATILLLLLTAVAIQAQNKPDRVDIRLMDPQACCFEMMLENTHTPSSQLNHLTLRIITPGVTFQPAAGGPWPALVDADRVVYGEQGIILQSQEIIEGFNFCLEFSPGQPRTVEIEWQTDLNGTPMTTETVNLDCTVQLLECDTISVAGVTIPNQPEGTCGYEFTLKNLHLPVGNINEFRLMVQTPGASLAGTATGPWNVVDQNSNSVTFASPSSPLATGGTLKGFRIFVLAPQGLPGNQIIRWISSLDGQILCEENIVVNCIPKFAPRADTLLMKDQQNCSYDLGFINKHEPKTTINRYRLSVVTPGASFASVAKPTGWTITSQTGLNVYFEKSGAPVASGDSAKGFLATFKPSTSGVVRFVWTTFNGNTIITRDTVQVTCIPPPPVYCDSLLVHRLVQSCTFDFGFVNKHQPQTGVNDFHIRLQDPSTSIDEVTAPAGWIVESRTSTEVVFKDTVGIVDVDQEQTGFIVSLKTGDLGNFIMVEWCTSLDGSINCCQFETVECTPIQERCDSLSVTPSQDYCSYSFGLTNLQIPASGLDAFRLQLDNPGAAIIAAEAPSGWTLDTLDQQMLLFVKTSGTLNPGETADGFTVHFVPSAISSQIPFTWCTEIAGQQRCCDTSSVACEIKLVQCDVIDVVTSTERPCCFDFNVQNIHLPLGLINGFNVQIITPGVTLFNSTITDPDGWTHISNSTRVGWRNTTGAILSGATLGGFNVCYDNSPINNADFQIVTQTVENGLILCQDTLTIKCDNALSVELLMGSRPDNFRLHQNYPNPFNPMTTIMFDLPERSDVILSLYDANGRLVMDLGSGEYAAGSWQIKLDASALPSGTYHYQLRTGKFSASRSLILLK
ncbi:MAG: T9SS type A sorting domain-containing protein [Bacteroidota bacterium]